MTPITIFHTADLHNRLTPAAARHLARLKREHPGSLLLDAGDAVAAGNLTYRLLGEPILRVMADVGYNAMAMGNRESHPLRQALERKLRDASFPVLAANIRARRRPLPEIVRSHLLLSVPGARVGVIGLAPQMTRPSSLWARVTDYVFDDPMGVAVELAGRLREDADLVVCLSHCGERIDRELAALPQVDLVLGGHLHRDLTVGEPGRALIVYPGHHGSHVARTEITPAEGGSKLLPNGRRGEARSELIPLERGR
jgi:5'-nucleotidase